MSRPKDSVTPMKNSWRAETEAELAALVSMVHVDVPFRAEGRTKDHAERYCMARLLAALPANRLRFPLQLDHDDRPDFVLSMQEDRIGIEHTEVVPENVAHSEFLRGKGRGPDVYFTPHAAIDEPKKTGAQLIAEIEADDMGDGWCGDSFERDWAAAMLHFIQAKSVKALAEGFDRYAENWILLYDNWPGPNLDFGTAVSFLQGLLTECGPHAFDSIFIIHGEEICEITGQATFFKIP